MKNLILKNWSEKKQNLFLIFRTWFIFLCSAGISCYLIGEITRVFLSASLKIQSAKQDELIKEIQLVEKDNIFFAFGVIVLLTIIMLSISIKSFFKLRVE